MSVPLLLFVYKRVNTTKQVLNAIRSQTVKPSKLFVFSDGSRSQDDEELVNAVRGLFRSIDWIEVELVEREVNLGLSENITQGISQVLGKHDRAVILEDDTLPANSFFQSCVNTLDYYADIPEVFSVGGYPHLLSGALRDYSYDVIISPRFSAWGWGTWADRWLKAENLLRNYENPFGAIENIPNSAGYDLKVMAQQMETHEDKGLYSWAVPINLYCLYNNLSHAISRHYLITNIGIDIEGVHGKGSKELRKFTAEHNKISEKVSTIFPPTEVRQDVTTAIQEYIKAVSELKTSRNLLDIVKGLINRLVGRI